MMPQVPAEPGATIRLVDVYAEQIKIGAQLAVIHEQLKAIPDHETRIRALERWRYGLPLAGLISAGSGALAIWSVIHH